ncbi:D-alanyl-D-alanine carboxypeptidase family protein [Aliivibrio fischeri]|uniref:M15 family metallopeptidase n=1 Tax=Aliivibrio fischeri TaxID=668 RepID=UPI0012DA9490|nr:M15 family metallopeptidase [Aliivibrio fischeri]MUJ29421.1 D-alanyl-D-alanine carboxypeptidase family protein [Aliivibrio fischeri]
MIYQELTGQSFQHLSKLSPHRQLHHDCILPFKALSDAAHQAGFTLTIASSFRDFERQLLIWNNKFLGIRPILDDDGQELDPSTLNDLEKIHAIMRWSALPGASRHHWGTELDVYASNTLPEDAQLQLEPWEYNTGHQAEFSSWLNKNAPKFGFFFPYKTDKKGVAIEPWHISYKQNSSAYMSQLTPEMLLKAWEGVDLAGKETIIKHIDTLFVRYITNIDKE